MRNSATGQSLDNPQCPACRFNEPHPYYIAGVLTTGQRCRKSVVTFPETRRCPYFEREPGAD